jgi:putative oxidoreductase
MNTLRQYGLLLARILLALIFVISGISKIFNFSGTVSHIQGHGLPASELLAALTIILEAGGGSLLILGWKARWAAAALFIFTLLVTLTFHAFWAVPADQAAMQQIQFMKNLAIMGGMLYVIVYGSGPLSLESK